MPKPLIIVLMPFKTELDDIFEIGIREVCEGLGARCERLDNQVYTDTIHKRITSQIITADLVIADVIGCNPNVLYEVGLAHAHGKHVVLLVQDAAQIPFDLEPHNHIVYGGRIVTLREKLRRHVSGLIGAPGASPHGVLRALEGCWIQEIRDSHRPVSITHIRFTGDGHEFHGANFHVTGDRFATFDSRHLFWDPNQQRLWYIYQFREDARRETEVWGFGWLEVERRREADGRERYVLAGGTYRSLIPGEVPRTVTLHPLRARPRTARPPRRRHERPRGTANAGDPLLPGHGGGRVIPGGSVAATGVSARLTVVASRARRSRPHATADTSGTLDADRDPRPRSRRGFDRRPGHRLLRSS